MKDVGQVIHVLLDAGFTTDEIEQVADDLRFAIFAVIETDQSQSLGIGRDWTPEKRAAWDSVLPILLSQIRARDE